MNHRQKSINVGSCHQSDKNSIHQKSFHKRNHACHANVVVLHSIHFPTSPHSNMSVLLQQRPVTNILSDICRNINMVYTKKYSWIKWKTFPFIGLDFSLATDG
jgi:hypothetical protein